MLLFVDFNAIHLPGCLRNLIVRPSLPFPTSSSFPTPTLILTHLPGCLRNLIVRPSLPRLLILPHSFPSHTKPCAFSSASCDTSHLTLSLSADRMPASQHGTESGTWTFRSSRAPPRRENNNPNEPIVAKRCRLPGRQEPDAGVRRHSCTCLRPQPENTLAPAPGIRSPNASACLFRQREIGEGSIEVGFADVALLRLVPSELVARIADVHRVLLPC